MPVSLNQFFSQAQNLQDSNKVFVSGDGSQVSAQSSLHGIAKLSVTANRAERREAVRTFLRTLESTPQFAGLQQMREGLQTKLLKARPLTAGDVKQAQRAVDAHVLGIAQSMEASKALPPGTAAAFSKFAMERGLVPGTEQEKKTALLAFMQDVYLPANARKLVDIKKSDIPGALPDAPPMAEGLSPAEKNRLTQQREAAKNDENVRVGKVHTVLQNSFSPAAQLAKQLPQLLAGDTKNFFTRLTEAAQKLYQNHIGKLSGFNVSVLTPLANKERAQVATTMAAMDEVQEHYAGDTARLLTHTIAATYAPLASQTERQNLVRGALLEQAAGCDAFKAVVSEAKLPALFASAIGSNAEVVRAAMNALEQDPGSHAYPTPERAQAALQDAARAFLGNAQKLAAIKELADMIPEPPDYVLRPRGDRQADGTRAPAPLKTPPHKMEEQTAIMARYVNLYLASEPMLHMLRSEEFSKADALDHMASYSDACKSTWSSLPEDAGNDDLNGAMSVALRLRLDKQGVQKDQLPELFARTVQRLGPLASEIHQAQRRIAAAGFGAGAMNNAAAVNWCMRCFDGLQGQARNFLLLMDREQLEAQGILDKPLPENASDTDATAARIAQQTMDSNKIANYLGDRFEQEVAVTPECVRYLEGRGFNLPDMSADAGKKPAAVSVAANAAVRENILTALLPKPGAAVPQGVAALFTRLNANGALQGVDVAQLRRGALEAVGWTVEQHVRNADSMRLLVSDAQLQRTAEDALHGELAGIKSALDALDAAPDLTPQQRAAMKAAVHCDSLRDVDALRAMSTATQQEGIQGALGALTAPGALSPTQLAESLVRLSTAVVDTPGGQEHVPALCQLLLEGRSEGELKALSAALASPEAMTLAGLCLHGLRPAPGGQEPSRVLGLVPQLIRHLGQSAAARLEFAPCHPCQVPLGSRALLNELDQLAPAVFDNFCLAMNRSGLTFTEAQWEQVRDVHQQLAGSAQGHDQRASLASFVAASAGDLLAAVRHNHGKPLSPQQIFKSMSGLSLPKGTPEAELGKQLLDMVGKAHQQLWQTAGHAVQSLTRMGELGLTMQQLLALSRPRARLRMADVPVALRMGPLPPAGEQNLYGLDVAMAAKGQLWKIGLEHGQTKRDFGPAGAQGNGELPQMAEIAAMVGQMTGSAAQRARVLQCLGNAPLEALQSLSAAFPGVELNPRDTVVSARQGRDGSVEVRIASAPRETLRFSAAIRVFADGSYSYEDMELQRR